MKALLLNMKDFTIVKEFDSMAAAEEAQDSPEYQEYPKHLVERDAWDLTAVDLAKFYNNMIPAGAAPVKRFSDRAAGMARVLRALNGEVLPVTDETAIKEQTRKKRTGNFKPVNNEETEMSTKKSKTKKTRVAKAKTTATPRTTRSNLEAVIKPTKVGQERRWQTGRDRSKLFAWIVDKGEVTIAALIKYGETYLKLEAGTVRAALQKMVGDECVKVSG